MPKIILFGDSHSYAVQRAIERRVKKNIPVNIQVYRLLKQKGNIHIGDTTLDKFIDIAKSLRESDVIYSMIGGNQHAVISTIQHPMPFDFVGPSTSLEVTGEGMEIIPYHVIRNFFDEGVRRGDGLSIAALRSAVRAPVIHIIPPPPKRDNEHIRSHHESRFADDGIAELGVSPPMLRMKCWQLQTDLLQEFCSQIDVQTMLPPAEARDKDGFLLPEFYANDATHANPLYGELLMQAIERRWM